MKHLLTLIFAAFGLLNNGFAQRVVPVKGDNLIILTTFTESDSLNFQNISKYLLSNGYTFQERDKELMYIKTDLKTSLNNNLRPSAVHHQLIITFNGGNQIVIRLKVELVTLGLQLTLVDWRHPAEMMKSGDFYYWQWYYNVKPLLERYPDQVSLLYYKE